MSTDSINNLPVNGNNKPSPQDLRVMNAVFGSNGSEESGIKSVGKILIPGALFLVLNLPIVDALLSSQITASNFVMILIKFGIFILLLLIFQFIGIA